MACLRVGWHRPESAHRGGLKELDPLVREVVFAHLGLPVFAFARLAVQSLTLFIKVYELPEPAYL